MGADGYVNYQSWNRPATTTLMVYRYHRRWRPVMWVLWRLSYLTSAATWFAQASERFLDAARDRATDWSTWTTEEVPNEEPSPWIGARADTLWS